MSSLVQIRFHLCVVHYENLLLTIKTSLQINIITKFSWLQNQQVVVTACLLPYNLIVKSDLRAIVQDLRKPQKYAPLWTYQ